MAHSIDLPEDLIDLIKQEAALQSRSIGEQIIHWIKIGHAIEGSSSFDYTRVLAALAGKLPTHELTDAEDAVWLATFSERMGEGTKAEDEFYARLSDSRENGFD